MHDWPMNLARDFAKTRQHQSTQTPTYRFGGSLLPASSITQTDHRNSALSFLALATAVGQWSRMSTFEPVVSHTLDLALARSCPTLD